MMQIIADTRSISFGQTFQLYFRDLAADCVLGSNKLASYIASNQTAAEKAIADLIAAYEDIE